jgi:hypothetical protein
MPKETKRANNILNHKCNNSSLDNTILGYTDNYKHPNKKKAKVNFINSASKVY